MNKTLLLLAALLWPTLCVGSAETAAGPARAERLLNAMGGREAWSQTKIVIVEATHFDLKPPTSYTNRIVNDLENPRVLFEAHAPGWGRWATLEGLGGHSRRDDDVVITRSDEAIAEDYHWWAGNLYRTLHRLAKRDPTLTVEAVEPDRLEIRESEQRLCWFRLSTDGAPVLFGRGADVEATILGPLQTASNGVRYPAWGAGDLGAWRYQVDRFIPNPSVSSSDFKIPAPR